ncbi:MAG: class I adenylate-forming enzyme family protein [bacterium]
MKKPTDLIESNKRSTAVVNYGLNNHILYDELYRRVHATANRLHRYGLDQGSIVACRIRPSVDFGIIYFAGVIHGLSILPVSPGLPENELDRLLREYSVDYLINGTSLEMNRNLPVETVAPDDLVTVEDPGTLPADNSREHRLLIKTSGTTGDPKLVELTWENMIASARASRRRLGVRDDDVWVSPLPTNHVGGIAPYVRSLVNGTAVAPINSDPESILLSLTETNATAISLVPTMLRDLLDRGLQGDQTRLRFILLGGAPAEETLVDEALDRGLPVRTTYGMTETASQVATASPSLLQEHPGTVGQPLDGITVRIDAGSGDSAKAGETGEIVVDGPMVAEGYWSASSEDDGFSTVGYRTGDIGYMDEQNRLWVVGRKDRLIISGGENIHPANVETAIESLEYVSKASVLGIESDRWGQKVVACIVPSDSGSLDSSLVKGKLEDELPPHKVPKEVYPLDELPRTETGTINLDELRQTIRNRSK